MSNNVYADEADRLELGRRARGIRAVYERAGDGGWYCVDDRSYDGTNECGHGRTKDLALADLLEKLEDA